LQRGNQGLEAALRISAQRKVRQRRAAESAHDVKLNHARTALKPVSAAFAAGHIGGDQRCGRLTQQSPRKDGAARNLASGLRFCQPGPALHDAKAKLH